MDLKLTAYILGVVALDYSKCLGHSQNKQIIDLSQNSKTLLYDEFREVIGLQKLRNEIDVDENFQLLVKIFTKLEPTQINVEQVILKETNPTLIVDEMKLTDIPIIFDNAPLEASCSENDIIVPENKILHDVSNCIPD
ncbi:hypothetical protein QE152_g1319 [Popillia japonica]|uniref:Uncharacterized protein n=1 Tax=Popillia japonica TaxID=7064 RepID=A0AAW1N755_POPJA